MAEFTGERVIPSEVDANLLNEHMARYAFAARLATNKRVLDAGCGAGYGSAELAKVANAVMGLDASLDALKYAREHYCLSNLRFEQATCSALPHPDASFDLVVGFEVIEHLQDWRGFLSEARRVLAAEGWFVVSTPNRLYYAESRKLAGPNPFHTHEFEFDEFRDELSNAFARVSLFLENHVEGFVFQPLDGDHSAEAWIEENRPDPASAHFFVAVCGNSPPGFVYVPSSANLLREREQHIALLNSELHTKNCWLENATQSLAALNQQHQDLLAMFRAQQQSLEESNRWAERLGGELEQSGRRIRELECELTQQHEGYESKIGQLEQENQLKTEWAIETETRLNGELETKSRELVQCVELLHAAEETVRERTEWAQRLQEEAEALNRQIGLVKASRWIKVGRRLGLGPALPAS